VMFARFLVSATLIVASGTVAARNDAAADEAPVRGAITKMAPAAKIESIAKSAMPGVYEAMIDGQIVYVSANGEFLLSGALWHVNDHKNLTEPRYAQRRAAALSAITPSERIVFAAAKPTHKITVFTDIDCGYCRKLHQQVQAFNDAGITIEYLLFPRAGVASPAYAQAVAVSCADDRNDALTQMMKGVTIAGAMCPNPVARTFEIGRSIGISATPTIVAEDGTLLGGYLEPGAVLAKLTAMQSPK
jgi:thiol:disulfide interchange protein DsbC